MLKLICISLKHYLSNDILGTEISFYGSYHEKSRELFQAQKVFHEVTFQTKIYHLFSLLVSVSWF